MYNVSTTNRFDKDLKRCMKRGLNMQLIYDAISCCEQLALYHLNIVLINWKAIIKDNGLVNIKIAIHIKSQRKPHKEIPCSIHYGKNKGFIVTTPLPLWEGQGVGLLNRAYQTPRS